MVSADERLDVTMLTQAIDVLERPMNHSKEQVEQAQAYAHEFKVQHAEKLHMFFLSYYEFPKAKQ